VARIREENRIAVGGRSGHGLRRDEAAGARTIRHDDLLPEAFGELVRIEAGQHVDGRARRQRRHDRDGRGRIAARCPTLGMNGSAGRKRCRHHHRADERKFHCLFSR
jgi:hypothetical protein